MICYKYKSCEEESFKESLDSLDNNYFWGADYKTLNDPCEAMFTFEISDHPLFKALYPKNSLLREKEIKKALASFTEFVKGQGVFSMSKSYSRELLWAHYAQEHKGFCLGYDIQKLVDNNPYKRAINNEHYKFDVEYRKELPKISADTFENHSLEEKLRKIIGTKSLAWANEEEIRVITNKVGKNYYEYDALKSIHFGYRIDAAHKILVMKTLKGRGIQYFDMVLEENSYKFIEKPVLDEFEATLPYSGFYQVKTEVINYNIIDKNFDKYPTKSVATILLKNKISNKSLKRLACDIKRKMFLEVNNLGLFFTLSEKSEEKGKWATVQFLENKVNFFRVSKH